MLQSAIAAEWGGRSMHAEKLLQLQYQLVPEWDVSEVEMRYSREIQWANRRDFIQKKGRRAVSSADMLYCTSTDVLCRGNVRKIVKYGVA